MKIEFYENHEKAIEILKQRIPNIDPLDVQESGRALKVFLTKDNIREEVTVFQTNVALINTKYKTNYPSMWVFQEKLMILDYIAQWFAPNHPGIYVKETSMNRLTKEVELDFIKEI